ncbi:MAG: GHKL domain-containing protein [Gemmatimonadetes bacterium]|nr:MAG: GHKL domain-containing protein [Gemmatimonadota bacterium]
MMANHNDLLRNISFFKMLSDADLSEISAVLTEEFYPAGTLIFEEGSVGHTFYIIKSGRIEITKRVGESKEHLVAIEEVNDFFGEMALLEHKPRSATVRSLEDTYLLGLSQTDFDQLLAKNPVTYYQIARALSSRLREANDRMIRDLQAKNRELQQAYDELKQAKTELVAREKLAMIGSVTSRIVHDIKSPITCIMGYAELIYKQSPESRKYCQTISHEVERLTDMIQEVLEFARGDDTQLNLDRYNLTHFLDQVMDFVRMDIERLPIDLETDYDLEVYGVFDGDKMRRVLHNLIANAVEAVHQGGLVRVSAAVDGTTLILQVFDSGSGIPAEIAEHLFEPFVTFGKPRGTGLGLAICKNIIEAHRGTISFQHAAGEGTTFTVTLPDAIR